MKTPGVDLHPEASSEDLAFQRLALAIIKTAVDDMIVGNTDAKYFLTGQSQRMREWRRHWFDQAGLTEQGVEWAIRKAYEWKAVHEKLEVQDD